jgi:ABC-type antimicrobial peptide transport system permease subunit
MGRDFTEKDGSTPPKVALINRSLAQRVFGTASPIGRQFQVRNSDKPDPPVEIIGVVGDARYGSLRDTLAPTIYVPWAQSEGFGQITFEVRTEGSITDAVSRIIAVAGAVAPNASLQISTLSGQLEASLARERLLASLSGFFGGLALLLALIGLYGTMAYNVTRRRKEIGIRVALGATRGRLLGLVTGEAARMVVTGLLLGGVATFAATRLVRSFLFGRTPLDPTTMIVSAVAVAGVALLAGALPAVKAVRQDPQSVLREE